MLHVTPESPTTPAAATLVTALCAELAERAGAPAELGNAGDAPRENSVPRGIFLVAWFGGDAVGCGEIRPIHEVVAEVQWLYVQPAVRSRGIGREILRELERHARAFGYRRLCIELGDRQPEATRLVENSGFKRIAAYGARASDAGLNFYGKDLPASVNTHRIEPAPAA